MPFRYLLAIILCLASLSTIKGQTTRPWEELFSELTTDDDVESAEWEETYEMLCDLEQHPIDINTATEEQLLQLPFLNKKQVEDILSYVYFNNGIKSLGELAMIESIDYTTRCLLTYFTYCGEKKIDAATTLRNMLHYGRNEVVGTAGIPFYERHGDKNGYLGYQYRHSVRYRFQYSNRLKIGFIGSQDAGEPFFANKNKWGYDHYSLYAEVHDIGIVKSIVAGQYRASFGLGLVIGDGTGIGKMSNLSALGSRTYGLRAHTSRNAANSLRGAGATINVAKGLDLSAFVSYRNIDATLHSTDSTASTITTIVTSGMHRTVTEMNKKNNSTETSAGGNVRFFSHGFHLGSTFSWTKYDKDLLPNTSQAYHKYDAVGNNFWNVSANYGYTGHNLAVQGETATGDGGALATIHTLSFSPSSRISLMALHRFYSKKYHARRARSFSEGGKVQNESGVYLGAQWQPSRRIKVMAYSDYAFFPASKYNALASSQAWDNLLQMQYTSERLTLSLRYKLKMKEYDNSAMTGLALKTTHRGHASISCSLGRWRCATQAELSLSNFEGSNMGWMVAQNIGYTQNWLRINATIGYFDTDDYESRVYGYEQGVLYSYSYLSYYGEGIRWSVAARATLRSNLTLIAHLSTTDYFDRSHISSSLQQIDHSSKTDLELQLQWKF